MKILLHYEEYDGYDLEVVSSKRAIIKWLIKDRGLYRAEAEEEAANWGNSHYKELFYRKLKEENRRTAYRATHPITFMILKRKNGKTLKDYFSSKEEAEEAYKTLRNQYNRVSLYRIDENNNQWLLQPDKKKGETIPLPKSKPKLSASQQCRRNRKVSSCRHCLRYLECEMADN